MRKIWLMAFLLFCSITWADIVILKDGRRFEGKIIQSKKDHIVILINKGTYRASLPIKRSMISTIQKQKKTSWEELREEYKQKEKSLRKNPSISGWDKLARWCKKRRLYGEEEKAWEESFQMRKNLASKVNSPSVWYRLALWCKEKKFYKKAQQLYARVVDMEPNHLGARKALGYKKYKNSWVSGGEYERNMERDMRMKGYVKYHGKWYTAPALSALVKIKKIEQGEEIKKLMARCNNLDKNVEKMGKIISQMSGVVQSLRKKVDSQKNQADSLYKRVVELEIVLRYWYYKHGDPTDSRNPWYGYRWRSNK